MKARIIFTTIVLALVTATTFAQSYSIDWHKIAGGGGTSTGGVFSISGTIGQPDAGGALTGGNYSLTGGYWSLFALQTPGTPLLTITSSGNNAVISWPVSATSFTLQTNGTLATANWFNYGGIVNTNAGIYNVIITPPKGNLFFRLKQ